jgi:hypothetical protein
MYASCTSSIRATFLRSSSLNSCVSKSRTSLIINKGASSSHRQFHSSIRFQQLGFNETEPLDEEVDEDEVADARKVGVRKGRPFLDPRAPRRIEAIRNDPVNKSFGFFVDILEHEAYCDGQREEDEDGFFFDGTRAEYDSDNDGDPFANGYLTEDEYEFDENYKPIPYIPRKVIDQIFFLYSIRNISIPKLSQRYRLSKERIGAIITLKLKEPEFIADGRYNTEIDKLMCDLYGPDIIGGSEKISELASKQVKSTLSPTLDIGVSQDNYRPDGTDLGINFMILQDDQLPDDVLPLKGSDPNAILQKRHILDKIKPVEKKKRVHASKFVIRDISSKKSRLRSNSFQLSHHSRYTFVADFNGTVRKPTNLELLYRPNMPRVWSPEAEKGSTKGLPIPDPPAKKEPKKKSKIVEAGMTEGDAQVAAESLPAPPVAEK